MSMIGYINSVQSLGAVDGPGLRFVIFLQGCPLRCVYCHNPETWPLEGGTATESEELIKRVLRYKDYFGSDGGVTLSGGEPLLQADFAAEFFEGLHKEGIHTALDTSCSVNFNKAEAVLKNTDLVLADLKFLSPKEYMEYCGADVYENVKEFFKLTEEMKVPVWVRHVLVPGITASRDYIKGVKDFSKKYKNIEKIEWLPFHDLCKEKYENAGVEFPLKDTPALSKSEMEELLKSAEV